MSGPTYSTLEMEAAEGLVALSQEQIFGMEAAALTLLDINRLPISIKTENELKMHFKEISIKDIQKNSQKLIEYGIIPPIEIADGTDLDGGAEKRQRTPSLREQERLDELAQDKLRKEEQRKALLEQSIQKEERESYRRSLEGKTAVDTFTGKTFDTLDVYLQNFDVCQPNKASAMMNMLFPPTAVTTWTSTMEKNCRDIYEPGAIEAQCNNVIGKVNLSTDVCYICGTGFYTGVDDPRLASVGLKVREGVRPTCEHILPIIQAIFFLDLYRGTDKGKLSAEKLDILKKEYSWAHECCNYVKSDDSFLATKINTVTKLPSWDFSTNNTSKVLSDIFNTRGKYAGLEVVQREIKSLYKKEVWLKARIDYIRDQKMKRIVDHIKSKGNGGIVMVMGYGNCVDSTKINEKFLAVLGQLKKTEPSPPSSQQSAITIGLGRRRRTFRSKKSKYLKKKARKTRRHK